MLIYIGCSASRLTAFLPVSRQLPDLAMSSGLSARLPRGPLERLLHPYMAFS
jgi:hypothetical protein